MNWKLIRIIDAYVGVPLLYALRSVRALYRTGKGAPASRGRRRILLIKFWGIGNIFMMLPSVEGLRNAFPSAAIDLLTLRGNGEAAEATQSFTSVSTIDTGNMVRFAVTTYRAVVDLRRKGYDVIIDFEQFAKFSAVLCALIGKSETVGFNTQGKHRHFLYSCPVAYDNTIHVTRSYFALVRAAGADHRGPGAAPRLKRRFSDATLERRILDKLGIRPERVVVVMHMGTSGNFRERRWPTSSYAKLAALLIRNHDVQIIMTGLPEEVPLASGITDRINGGDRIVEAIGALNFREFFALLHMSDLVVSADTAPVHLASAAGIPVAGLYGPNIPLLYGPWGENGIAIREDLACSPCITNFNAKINVCRHPEGKGACMKRIQAEDVYTQLRARYFDRDSPCRLKKLARLDLCTR